MDSKLVNEDFLAEAHHYAVLNKRQILTDLCKQMDDAADEEGKELAVHIIHETCWLLLHKLYSNFIGNGLDIFSEFSDKMKTKLKSIEEENL